MTEITIRELIASKPEEMTELLDLFAVVFDDQDTYSRNRPDNAYQSKLLQSGTFIALLASVNGQTAGGLAA